MAERKGSAVTGNGFDPKQAKLWQGEYEKHNERLLELRMAYMADCKDVREDMSDVLDRAKEAGISKRLIKDTSKIRELNARINKIESHGESEENETLQQFRHALGDLADTPLGQAAAANKAKGMPGADAPASIN
jgi:uncharacterized protein (UPF0335 family)